MRTEQPTKWLIGDDSGAVEAGRYGYVAGVRWRLSARTCRHRWLRRRRR